VFVIIPLCDQTQIQKTQPRCRCPINKTPYFIPTWFMYAWIWALKSLYKNDMDFGELFEACQAHPKGDFVLQGVTYSRVTSYVCQGVAPVSLSLERSIVVPWTATLEKTRHTWCLRSITFVHTCLRISKTWSRDAKSYTSSRTLQSFAYSSWFVAWCKHGSYAWSPTHL